MPHFFISYAKKDTRDLAIALNDALNALPNVTAWVDTDIEIGKSWETQIQREIRKCDYFIVLYSPDLNRHLEDESLSESYVLTEIHYAKEILKKPIIPVMAQATTPPMSLIRLQHIDYTQESHNLEYLREKICIKAGIPLQNNQPVVTVSIPYAAPKTSTKPAVKDILPPPFDWCDIPEGKVTLQEGGYVPEGGETFDVSAFFIGKYPITNAQYKVFVDAGGYENEKWWMGSGQVQKIVGRWTEPRYWQENLWNGADYPVVGIAWYEAVAFCWWLSETTGEKITLPTEQQWQRAAQGETRKYFPYGAIWNVTNANLYESLYNRTTPVTAYPNGASPYGVMDIVGNVFEWCLTEYRKGTNNFDIDNGSFLTLRGSSYKNKGSGIKAIEHLFFRLPLHPEYRDTNYGFRIARLLN